MVTSFDEKKKVLSLKQLFHETYKFNMRCMFPAVVPLHYCILYMLQGGEYVLSPEFVSTFKKVNFNESEAYWRILHAPLETTIDDILVLIFNGASFESKTQLNNRFDSRVICT